MSFLVSTVAPEIVRGAVVSGAIGTGFALCTDTSLTQKALIVMAAVIAGIAVVMFGQAFGVLAAIGLVVGGAFGAFSVGPNANYVARIYAMTAGMLIGAGIGYGLSFIPVQGYHAVKLV